VFETVTAVMSGPPAESPGGSANLIGLWLVGMAEALEASRSEQLAPPALEQEALVMPGTTIELE
jgi:hypothetical protein